VFNRCTSLTNVTIPNSVTSIGDKAFYNCTNLTGVHFQGNAPNIGWEVFGHGENVSSIRPSITCRNHGLGRADVWRSSDSAMVASEPVNPKQRPRFWRETNGFGFIISWATNLSVVWSLHDLANPVWSPVEPTRSPAAHPISAIQAGRITPFVATASLAVKRVSSS